MSVDSCSGCWSALLAKHLRLVWKSLLFVLRILARSMMLGLTLCLEGYFCHALCGRYLELELGDKMETQNNTDKGDRDAMAKVYVCVALGLTLQVMSVLSLLVLSFSNPGYVSDYYVSQRVHKMPETLSSEEEIRLEDNDS